MDPALISALSALGGSILGGLISGTSTVLSQRAQSRAAQREVEITRVRDLHREFIIAASRAYGQALVSSNPAPQDLVDLYALVSRMRVAASVQTVDCAERVLVKIVDTFFAANKTVRELHESIKQHKDSVVDPLKEFAMLAREARFRAGLFRRRQAQPIAGTEQGTQGGLRADDDRAGHP